MTDHPARRARVLLLAAALGTGLAACSGNYAPDEDVGPDPNAGPLRQRPAVEGKLLGDDLSINALRDGSLFGSDERSGDAMPVNRYLWQGALDTLSFLPLDSTDPFTGVIATDWSAAPDAPSERFKVSVYMLSPVLEASSLRVAVFREARNEDGLWVPRAVNPETATRLENAILTRARQLRIAEVESEQAG